MVDFDDARAVTVTTQGAATPACASFVVNASGRDTFRAGRIGTKHRDPHHTSAAVFTHYKGVQRRPGPDAGNSSVTWFGNGWFWTIPLSDDLDSVGVVCDPDVLRTRKGSLDDFLAQTIATCPNMTHSMTNARPLSTARAAGNFSYKSSMMHGDHFLLIGGAYAFLDPMFSTGVFLAMESAVQGADAVHSFLTGPNAGRMHLNAPVARRASRACGSRKG